jgi:hypothetical protein
MSWPEEEPGFEPGEEELEDPAQLEEAAEDDPLAALEPEVRARVEAKIGATYEAKLQEDKKALSRTYNKAQQDAAAKGFKLVNGEISITDPEKARQWLGGTPAPKAENPADADAGDEEIQDWDSAAEIARKLEKRHAKATAAAVEAATKPLKEALEQVTGHVSRTQLGAVSESARPVLDELGIGYLADTEGFKSAFAQAIQSVPMAQRNDPQTIETAALMCVPAARRWAAENGVKPPKEDGSAQRAAIADHQRAQLGRTGPSRGTPSAEPAISAQDKRDWSDLNKMVGRTLSQKEYLALRDDQDASGSAYAAARGGR